ncbi:MAG: cytochrome c biogenesis protein ResB, partial [Proteobacteria bacterium]|nr:cytochrome c biogenesis protein ResB [Pseudomonadota bacterium]
FSINLLTCTVKHLLRTVRQSKDFSSPPEGLMLSSLPMAETFMLTSDAASKEQLSTALAGCFKRPRLIHEDPHHFYLFAERHKFAHLGFYLAHLSMLTLVMGIIASTSGFHYYIDMAKGQVIEPLTVMDNEGNLKTLDFGLQCRDFSVTYYGGGKEIKKIDCTLDILKNGKTAKTQLIDFAHALRYSGIDIIQNKTIERKQRAKITVTGRGGTIHTHMLQMGESFTLPGADIRIRAVSFKADRLQLISLSSPARLWISQADAQFAEQELHDYTFRLDGFTDTEMANLKIISDPGKEVVWTSIACLIAGFFVMFFFHHQRVWIKAEPCPEGCRVTIAGMSNKNIQSLHDVADRFKKCWGVHATATCSRERGLHD